MKSSLNGSDTDERVDSFLQANRPTDKARHILVAEFISNYLVKLLQDVVTAETFFWSTRCPDKATTVLTRELTICSSLARASRSHTFSGRPVTHTLSIGVARCAANVPNTALGPVEGYAKW